MEERHFPWRLPPADTEFGRLIHQVRARMQEHDVKGAIRTLKQASRRAPKTAEAHTTVGWLWLYFNKPREAIGAFQKALRYDRSYAPAHHGLGRALQEIGLYPPAEEHLRQALELQPDFPLYEADLGTFYFNTGRIKEAEVHLRRALELAEDDAQSHALLGYIAYLRDRLDEAIGHFEAAIRYQPEGPSHYNNLGFLYLLKGRVEDAKAMFEKALALRPRYIRATYNRALIAWLEEDDETAAELYAQAREREGSGEELEEHILDVEEVLRLAPLDADKRSRLEDLVARLRKARR